MNHLAKLGCAFHWLGRYHPNQILRIHARTLHINVLELKKRPGDRALWAMFVSNLRGFVSAVAACA